MDKKRNRADDDDIRPPEDELQLPKHVKREQPKAEDTAYMAISAHALTLAQLNRPVIKEGRVYPKRLKKGTARILVLHPGSASDDIKCDLRQREALVQASPDKVLSYEALSYVWGEENNPEFIFLCKCRFAVTRNLAELLRHVRLPNSARMLWVDAICINQCDEVEKKAQLESMHLVYGLAEKVIAWLGPSDDDSSLAYWLMGSIQKLDGTPVSAVVTSQFSNEDTRNKYDPFRKLMERPYWSRAWVVQEMVFARSLIIQCGSESVPYSTLEKAYPPDMSACMVHYSDKGDFMRVHFYGDREVRTFRLESKQVSLQRFLDCFLDRRCRERHDSIFAFLNFLGHDIRQQIPICYKSSERELLLHTARSIIKSTQSLYIIVIRGRQTPPCAEGSDKWQLEMPSWCPYFATPYQCCAIEPQDEPSLYAEKAVVSFLANNRLQVRGFVIGRVSRTLSRHMPPKVGATAWWDQADIHREQKRYMECLLLGLNGVPSDSYSKLMSLKATTRTLLAGRGGNSSDDDLIQWLGKARPGNAHRVRIALREIWHNKNSRVVCSFRLGRAATRAFYSSKMAPAAWINRVALVPHTVRHGDAICAILGCPGAVVLRRRGKGYHVLGEAFVDSSAMGPFQVAVQLRDFILG